MNVNTRRNRGHWHSWNMRALLEKPTMTYSHLITSVFAVVPTMSIVSPRTNSHVCSRKRAASMYRRKGVELWSFFQECSVRHENMYTIGTAVRFHRLLESCLTGPAISIVSPHFVGHPSRKTTVPCVGHTDRAPSS